MLMFLFQVMAAILVLGAIPEIWKTFMQLCKKGFKTLNNKIRAWAKLDEEEAAK